MSTWDEARWLADNDQPSKGNSMNETETKPRLTGTELATRGLDALDVTDYAGVAVDNETQKDQISGVDWMKVIDLGKALAAMQDGMPPHVRGKWGIACRIAANAHMWQMDPFGIADQTYVVNNRLGYMSQLIHALINRNAPLMHRLECHYIGEGPERQCRVVGQFISGDEREYITPKIKDIKVKNSPLWTNDADQQLWYFGVRSWGRKWVPEVVFGLYTREELQADRTLGYEETTPGLHARLKGSAPSGEGHSAESVTRELDSVQNGGSDDHGQPDAQAEEASGKRKAKPAHRPSKKENKRTTDRPKAKPAPKKTEPENVSQETKDRGTVASKVAYPSTVAEYLAYARRWIKSESSGVAIGERWTAERKMRNALGLTADDRKPLEELIEKQLAK